MARHARQQSSTGYYHVMLRGINKKDIFVNDTDKEKFLQLLKKQQDDCKIKITAWCIMSNHVHLILHAHVEDMSYAIKVVSGMYATYYNNKYDRIGSLFNNRFKSKAIESDEYLKCNVRYIHNNPVKANIVNQAQDYIWSSYIEYLHKKNFIYNEEKKFILKCFSNNLKSFADFHKQDDNEIYLEIKEDTEKIKYIRGYNLRQEYIKKYSITSAKQLHMNSYFMNELCYMLVRECGLSLRKTACLLETQYNAVDRHLKNYERTLSTGSSCLDKRS